MAIKAINTSKITPFWFTPEGQEGEANPVSFEIRGMDGHEQAYVGPGIHIASETIAGDAVQYMLGHCLLGWRNFENDEGPVKFSAGVVQNMKVIPLGLQQEIIGAIIEASTFSGEERKNSSSQSKSPETEKTSIAGDANGGTTATSPETGPGQ